MRVFVLLPRDLDAHCWRLDYERGIVPDETPYGYHHAAGLGCEVAFSRGTVVSGKVAGLIDKAIKRVLGFDILHAWRNREALLGGSYDIIWTHTEREHLGALLLSKVLPRHMPPIIAQSIWLVDEWCRFSFWKRWLYRRLLCDAEIASFHSPLNKGLAEKYGLGKQQRLVKFGISLDSFPLVPPLRRAESGRPVRVLAMGNDRHRDWAVLSRALGGLADFEVRIGSKVFPRALVRENFSVSTMSQEQIRAAYEWADCVVVPLKENVHVSGATAMLEAIAQGRPLIVTRAGGNDAYFCDDEVAFVPIGDVERLREAALAVRSDPEAAVARARAAQRRLLADELTTEGFAKRHVDLSRELCAEVGCEQIRGALS